MGTALVTPPTGRSEPEGGGPIPELKGGGPIPGLIEGGPRPRGSACASDAPSAESSNVAQKAKRARWCGWCARHAVAPLTRPINLRRLMTGLYSDESLSGRAGRLAWGNRVRRRPASENLLQPLTTVYGPTRTSRHVRSSAAVGAIADVRFIGASRGQIVRSPRQSRNDPKNKADPEYTLH